MHATAYYGNKLRHGKFLWNQKFSLFQLRKIHLFRITLNDYLYNKKIAFNILGTRQVREEEKIVKILTGILVGNRIRMAADSSSDEPK